MIIFLAGATNKDLIEMIFHKIKVAQQLITIFLTLWKNRFSRGMISLIDLIWLNKVCYHTIISKIWRKVVNAYFNPS